MSGAVIIVITIISCVIGYVINANYESQNLEPLLIGLLMLHRHSL